MSDERRQGPRIPPRWFVRLAWSVHRALYRVTGGRVGLWPPKANRWGALRLTTTGRRSGRNRSVIIAYLEDGPNLIAMAMNGWADGEPAWWLNLQAAGEATAVVRGSRQRVRPRVLEGPEREGGWAALARVLPAIEDYRDFTEREFPLVLLEPAE